MSTALLNLLFAQTIYKYASEGDAEFLRSQSGDSDSDSAGASNAGISSDAYTTASKPTSPKQKPKVARMDQFERLAKDLENHPLNTAFHLNAKACQSLYTALLPDTPGRPSADMLRPLLQKFFESYKKDIIQQIRRDEVDYKAKLSEIELLESGGILTKELLQELDSGSSSSSGTGLSAQQQQLQQLRLQKQLEIQQKQEQDQKIQLQKQQLQKQKQLERQQMLIKQEQQKKERERLRKEKEKDKKEEMHEHEKKTGNNEHENEHENVHEKELINEKHSVDSGSEAPLEPEDVEMDDASESEDKDKEKPLEKEKTAVQETRRSLRSLRRHPKDDQEELVEEVVEKVQRKAEQKASKEDPNNTAEEAKEEDDDDDDENENEEKDEEEKSENESEKASSVQPESDEDNDEDEETDEPRGRSGSSKRRATRSVSPSFRKFQQVTMPLLSEVSSNKSASLFLHPVNPNDAPNYYDIIKSPTDLRTIRTMVRTGEIRTTAEVERELQKMFANSIMYNSWDSDVSLFAREMQQEVDALLALFHDAERGGAVASVDDERTKRRKK